MKVLFAAAAALFATMPASAATFVINAFVTSGTSGDGFVSPRVTGAQPGDTIEVNFTISQPVMIPPTPSGSSPPIVIAGLYAFNDLGPATFELIGVTGDLVTTGTGRNGGPDFNYAYFLDVVLSGSAGGSFAGLKMTYDVQTAQIGRIERAVLNVPEPATWAMMIAGFGFVGASLRRQGRPASALSH